MLNKLYLRIQSIFNTLGSNCWVVNQQTDKQTTNMVPDHEGNAMMALKVDGDGNCLFRSLSCFVNGMNV